MHKRDKFTTYKRLEFALLNCRSNIRKPKVKAGAYFWNNRDLFALPLSKFAKQLESQFREVFYAVLFLKQKFTW